MNKLILCQLALIAAISSSHRATAEDWPQFLGPTRNGISTEENLIDSFGNDGPNVVWRYPGGVGMSGMAVADGAVYTMTQNDLDQFVVKLDAKTGDVIWQEEVAVRYRNQMGNGPRATPAVVDDRVFFFTGEGILGALDTEDGKVVWKHNTVSDLGGKVADYGMASSPLVIGSTVIVTVGAPDATVVAYSIDDGQLVWKAGSDRTGYSSSAVLEVGGEKQLVTYTGNSVIGINPANGDQLWRYEYETDYDCNTATPISIDGKVFVSSGENHGSVLLQVSRNGDAYTVSPVWESQGRNSVMRNEWQTAIHWDGALYGFDNIGSAGAVTHLACIDPHTGDRKWQEIRFGKGNAIAADGKMYMTTMEGDIVIVKLSPEGFEELDRADIDCKTRQGPSLSNGMLYVRDDEEVICIDLRK